MFDKRQNERDHIILMGVKHCGKSTLGKLLAKSWNWDFYDIDNLIEENFSPDRKRSVRSIYKDKGKDVFEALELISACKLSDNIKDEKHSVIALGGRTIENHSAMECIKDLCFMVYIEEEMDTLYERILRNGLPPFLSKENPYSDFKEIYNNRTKKYRMEADLTVNVSGLNIENSFEKIENELKEINYAR